MRHPPSIAASGGHGNELLGLFFFPLMLQILGVSSRLGREIKSPSHLRQKRMGAEVLADAAQIIATDRYLVAV